ncbi:MAG TPA: type III pantothenate kinase [Gemmataceae bacterium]|jgi:type III pantothenate kinase
MRPNVVVDVGNTRIKWGLCGEGAVLTTCSLPHGDPAAWERQMEQWADARGQWVVSGVHPQRRDQLIEWLRQRGQRVRLLDDPKDLPLRVLVARPDHVGVDRLLDAVAANHRRTPGTPAAVIDAGSAITVDLIDGNGAFVGGAILPGMRLMAQALHDYTALLPLLAPPDKPRVVPGTNTPAAMELGIFWAVAGGVQALVSEYRSFCKSRVEVFLTGGDCWRLHSAIEPAWSWPEMTLEGIRLSAEALQ